MLQKISIVAEKDSLTKEQKNFNKLLEKITRLKQQIEEGKALNKKREILYNTHINPLFEKLKQLKLSQLRVLDRTYEKETFAKRIRHELRYEILGQIEYILNQFSFDAAQHDEILTILAKHEGTTKEELEQEQKESREDELRGHLKHEYGIELDENEVVDFNDPEFLLRMKELIENAQQNQQERRQQKQSFSSTEKEKHSASVLDQMSKSLRSVYTRLVKHLHPDKELDENLKAEKTEAIKKVTEAYEKKDILTLLLLQIEHGILGQDTLKDTADQDLKHYNKILKKQADTLEKEHMKIMTDYKGLSFAHESALEKAILTEKNEIKKYLKKEEELLKRVFEEPDMLVQYLKQR